MVSNPFQDGLTVELGADASGLTSELDSAMESIGGLETAVVGLGSALAGLSAGGLAKSVQQFADFDAAMTESQAIMGDLTQGEMASMEEAAREVGRTTTFSADQAGEAFYFLASAGLDAEQSVQSLGDVAQFAQAGAFDLATATDLATDAQSSLGLASEDAAENQENLNRVMDVLVNSNQLANASVEQFSEALTNKAGAALKNTNKEVEEGAAVLAAYADQGIKGRKAGERLNIVLRDLQTAAQEDAEAFQDLGVQVYDSEGNMRNMADIIADLEDATAGMSTEQQNAAISTLGLSQQAADGITPLLGQSEAIRGYEQELGSAGGTAEEVANNQLKSLNAQWQILKSQINDIFLQIGDALAPALETLVGHVSGVVEIFGEWNRRTEGLGGALTLITGLITGVVGAAAGLASQLGFAASTTSALTGALSVLTGPIGIVIGAVAALGAAFVTNFGGVRDQTMRVVNALQEALQPAIGWFQTEGVSIVGQLRDAVVAFVDIAEPYVAQFASVIGDVLVGAIQTTAEVFTVAFGHIETVVTTVWNSVLQPFISWLVEAWQTHGDQIMAVVEPLWNGIQTIIDNAITIIQETVSLGLSVLKGDWQAVGESLKTIVSTMWDSVKTIFSTGFEMLKNVAQIGWNAITDWISSVGKDDIYNAFMAIGESIRSVILTLVDGGGWILEKIKGGLTAAKNYIQNDAKADIKAGFTSIVEGVKTAVSGLFSAGGELEQMVRNTISAISSYVRNDAWSDIKSAFNTIVEGVLAAFRGLYDGLIGNSIIPDMFNAITEFVTGWVESFISLIQNSLNNVYQAFQTQLQNVREFVTNTFTTIKEFVTTQISLIKEVISSTLSAIYNAFTTQFNLVLDLVTGIWQSLHDDTTSTWDVILEFITGTLDNIYSTVQEILSSVLEYFTDTFLNIRETAEEQFQNILDFITQTLDNIFSTAQETLDSILEAFESAFGAVFEAAEQFAQDVLSAIEGLLEDMLSAISNTNLIDPFSQIIADAIGFIQDKASSFYDSGKGLVDAMVDGIKESPQAVKNAVEDIVGEARDLLPWSDAKEGPLSDLTASGESIPKTIAEGAENNLGVLNSTLEEMQSPNVSPAAANTNGGGGPIRINVDARGAENPQQVRQSAKRGAEQGYSSALDAYNVGR